MKRTNLTLGLTLLLVAAAVAVYTTDGPGEQAGAREGSAAVHPTRGALTPRPGDLLLGKSSSPRHASRARFSVIDSLGVEPTLDHPAIAAQAERIQRGARSRLQELDEELELTQVQQRQLFPLLARSHPHYNESVRLVGAASSLLTPLSKRAAQEEMRRYLDPDQQLDLEIMALEADAWWRDIIAALERDLEQSTEPLSSGRKTEHTPTPPREDPPDPQTTAPSSAGRASGRGRSNLNDLGVE